jgi:hypothetical protein
MHTPSPARASRRLLATCIVAVTLLVALSACGNKSITGTYVGVPGQSVFDKVELRSGGRAIFTLIGIEHEATYTVNGATVVVKNPAGELHELKLDASGCLVDAIGGTYCKNGHGAAAAGRAAGPASPTGRAATMSGTYEAKGPEGASIAITFTDETRFNLVMNAGGVSNALPGSYQMQGDHVLLRVVGDSEVLDLTRRGTTLEGDLGGDHLKFVRK